MSDSLIRVAPYYYIHVLDNNTNTQRLEVGPQTFTRQDHEKVVVPPSPMIIVPPRHYCIIKDPYIRKDEATKEPLTDDFGQVKLRHGDQEIRFSEDWPDPFPLLPGEKLQGAVTEVSVVRPDTALRLVAKRDFVDEEAKQKRVAGDEWLFHGPGTYRPRIEVENVETINAYIIGADRALKLQARKGFIDRNGIKRKAGEEWLERQQGAYLPTVDEKVVALVEPQSLLQTRALHLRAIDTFKDVYGIARKAGEEWLVTHEMAEKHLQDVYEEIVGAVNITVLTKLQYCVVLDPVKNGKNQYGARELRKGESCFFLLPGERLEGGIQNIYVLGQEEALLLRAKEQFVDTSSEPGKSIPRTPGDLWMIGGPCDYVPTVEVEVVQKRQSIPLDENEGIYVRDIKTGKVRAVKGQTYMLKSYEELWEKDLPLEVEDLLNWSYFEGDGNVARKKRDKTRVVDYRVPHNAAVQIYDYKAKQSRVVFGPGMVMLDPDEQFTVISLSGDKPKRPNVIKTLSLMLGPDFMTDIIEVETSDHARLRLQLSYNWHFQIDRVNGEDGKASDTASQIFQVRDFVGDACKAIASRVRGAVAAVPFDAFHKGSAKLIRRAVFGVNQDGKIGHQFLFTANGLCITNIDIQSVEPVDERTRESLQKSVQLAIEITTKKQERNARHSAEAIEQDAKGKIERQKINNQMGAEEERQALVLLQGATKAIETAGMAKAEAEAKAVCLDIKASAEVAQAQLAATASNVEALTALEETTATQQMEVRHAAALAELDLTKAKVLADIEANKFTSLVTSIGPQTIRSIARAGPEMQARLLKGLGLKGYLMTDGNSPINLFNAAKGMVAPNMASVGM